MSTISAAAVAAVLLSVSIVATHGFGVFGPGTTTATVSAGRGPGPGVAPAPAAAIASPTRPIRPHPSAASGTQRGHRPSANAGHTGSSGRTHAGRGGRPGDIDESVHAGPVQASATAGSGGATVAVKAGPAEKKVK